MYEIITAAEQHPDVEKFRFRAIFAAYNEVLERHGLDPIHDQTYFRFLLKLGDQKRSGRSLYESFELLLQELGIQLEVNEDEGNIQDITREFDEEAASNGSREDLKTELKNAEAPLRRNSFGSPGIGRGRMVSKIENSLPPRPATRPALKSMDRSPQIRYRGDSVGDSVVMRHSRRIRDVGTQEHEAERRPKSRLGNGREIHHSPPRKSSHKVDPTVTPERPPYQSSNQAHDRLSHALQSPSLKQSQSYAVKEDELLYHPSETQCLRDADTFQNFHFRALLKQILHQWRGFTGIRNRRHKAQEYAAKFHDRNVLLRQALLLWQDQLHQSQRAAETRRFYHALESRASKARDLYLLAKAFTHWAESTIEEIVKTKAARQHIVQLKYFNAWREITAVNELKVKRHGLKKFFKHWREHSARHGDSYIAAITHHDEKLAKWIHWKWFWTFCESRIPIWRDVRTKRNYFARWFRAKNMVQEREWQREEKMFRDSISSILMPWLKQARLSMSQRRVAESFDDRNVKNAFWKCWKRRYQHVLPERQISNMVDWRVAGTTFALFVARFRAERQAESVCNLRITRNTWTIWNDQLRCQILSKQINDRVLVEALYRWIIAERSSLLIRLQLERLQKSALVRLYERCAELKACREESCQQLIQRRNRSALREAFHSWQSRLSAQHKNMEMAHAFLAPRLIEEAFRGWALTSKDMQKLEIWATRFDFFVAGRHFTRTWSNAVELSRKRKRQQAYGQIRRKAKMALAAKALTRWRGKALQLRVLGEQTVAFDQNRLSGMAIDNFDHWRAQTDSVLSLAYQAEDHWKRQTDSQYFRLWASCLDELQVMESKATNLYHLHIANIASSWLHTLRLRVIEDRAQEAKAAALTRYYERRRVGGWFRQWQNKTMEKLQRPLPQAPLSSRARRSALRTVLPSANFDATENGSEAVEQAFNESTWIPPDEVVSTATPALGYLTTPSKRAARAKALAAGSTTPAGTPLPVRLRQQLDLATPTPGSLALHRTPFSRVRDSRLRDQLDERPQTPE